MSGAHSAGKGDASRVGNFRLYQDNFARIFRGNADLPVWKRDKTEEDKPRTDKDSNIKKRP